MATRKDLLLELATFLEALPPERFDYGSWVGAKWKDAQDLSCGTTACALGWAATLPSCRQEGLRLGRDRFGDGTVHLESASGETAKAMAAEFGVCHSAAWRAIKGFTHGDSPASALDKAIELEAAR